MSTYRLNDKTFTSKVALEGHLRAIRDRNIGRNLSGQDLDDVLAYLAIYHPAPHEKLAGGVRRIAVVPNHVGPGHGFEILTPDGVKRRFSLRFSRMAQGQHARLSRAARHDIQGQIDTFKERALAKDPTCALTSAPVSARTCEVDHAEPDSFDSLLRGWLLERGLTPSGVAVAGAARGHGITILDPVLRRSWQGYHLLHARLRILATDVHRQIHAGVLS